MSASATASEFVRKRRRRRRIRRIIYVILFLVVVGFIAMNATRDKGPEVTKVTAEEVERRTLTSIVTATGRVFPEVEVSISSEVSGEIVNLPVREGENVVVGQILAEIDRETLEAQVRRSEAGLASAQASALQTEARLEQSRLDLRRLEQLGDFALEADLDQARTSLRINELQLEAAGLEIERQQTLLDETREFLDKTTIFSPMEGTISMLASELGERVVATGQFAGTEIMRVADLNNMEVRIDVNENDIVNVAIGQYTSITIDAYPDQFLDGSVYEIANSPTQRNNQDDVTTFEVRVRVVDDLGLELRPGMTATAEIETQTVSDVISVPIQAVTVRERKEIERALRGDDWEEGDGEATEDDEEEAEEDSALANLSPEEAAAAARAERRERALERKTLRTIVWVVEDDRVVIRQVETGIADNTHIEIVSGLDDEETIVTGGYGAVSRGLEHDDAIEVEEERERNGRDRGNRED